MWSSAIVVHPWVGEYYQNPKHLLHKTLVLGESNFTQSDNFKSDLVKKCVLNDLSVDPAEERDTTGFCRFSTKIRRIVFGRGEPIDPSGFWHDVAFYNFVQSLVGDKARIRPTQEMWVNSIPAFLEVVLLLQPKRILVLGKANWDNLLAHIEHEIVDPFTVNLKFGSESFSAGYINHPSSSLSYQEWTPIAQKFLLN